MSKLHLSRRRVRSPRQIIDNDRYPFSPRVRTPRGILRLYARTDKRANSWYMVAMTKSARTNPTDTLSTRRRVKPASPPAWIKPQLAALAEKAPAGPDWLNEIKLVGYGV